MLRGSLFWGVILILVGAVFLIGNLFGVDAWRLVGPGLLILFGLWVLWGAALAPRTATVQNLQIHAEGAARGRVILHHGAGVVHIGPGASPGDLLAGEFVGGVHHRPKREADTLEADLRVPADGFLRFGAPWAWHRGFEWSVRLTEALPLSLRLETGAGEANLDLTDLKVTDLQISTGASSTTLRLPARAGASRVRVEAGVASVRVFVPEGVAARIYAAGGLSDQRINRARFPRSGAYYQSPDYDTAANKVEINIQTGLGSVEIH